MLESFLLLATGHRAIGLKETHPKEIGVTEIGQKVTGL